MKNWILQPNQKDVTLTTTVRPLQVKKAHGIIFFGNDTSHDVRKKVYIGKRTHTWAKNKALKRILQWKPGWEFNDVSSVQWSLQPKNKTRSQEPFDTVLFAQFMGAPSNSIVERWTVLRGSICWNSCHNFVGSKFQSRSGSDSCVD